MQPSSQETPDRLPPGTQLGLQRTSASLKEPICVYVPWGTDCSLILAAELSDSWVNPESHSFWSILISCLSHSFTLPAADLTVNPKPMTHPQMPPLGWIAGLGLCASATSSRAGSGSLRIQGLWQCSRDISSRESFLKTLAVMEILRSESEETGN